MTFDNVREVVFIHSKVVNHARFDEVLDQTAETTTRTTTTTTTTTRTTRTSKTIKPRYYKQKGPDRKLKQDKYIPYWLVVSNIRKVATTIVPKVMCTSIRQSMNDPNCKALNDTNLRCAEARTNSDVNNIDFDQNNYTTFVMIRDPFERAYSAYSNSVKNQFIHLEVCQNHTQCTFEEWVDELANGGGNLSRNNKNNTTGSNKYELVVIMPDENKLFRNEHFKAQTTIAQMDLMHYHYRLRLSSKIDVNFFGMT